MVPGTEPRVASSLPLSQIPSLGWSLDGIWNWVGTITSKMQDKSPQAVSCTRLVVTCYSIPNPNQPGNLTSFPSVLPFPICHRGGRTFCAALGNRFCVRRLRVTVTIMNSEEERPILAGGFGGTSLGLVGLSLWVSSGDAGREKEGTW